MARFRTIFLLALSLGLVTLAIGVLVSGGFGGGTGSRMSALAALIFFSACALTFALQLMPSTPPPTDAQGVTLICANRARLAGFTVASAMIAIACPLIASSADTWIGLAGGGFFGLGAAIGLFRLVQPSAMYRLDPVGLSSLRGPRWFVPWRVVHGLDAYGAADNYWLALAVDPAGPLDPGLRAQINKRAGYPAITVNISGSGIRFDEFTALVQRYWERGRLMQAHN